MIPNITHLSQLSSFVVPATKHPLIGNDVEPVNAVNQVATGLQHLVLNSATSNKHLTHLQQIIHQKTGIQSAAVVELIYNYIFPTKITGEHAYNKVISQIKNPGQIEQQLSAISDDKVSSVLENLEEIEWHADKDLFKNQELPLVLLKALKMGKITDQQLATSSFFGVAHRELAHAQQQAGFWGPLIHADKPIYMRVPLFDTSDNPTNEAVRIIKESVKAYSNTYASACTENVYSFLNDEQLHFFFTLMSELPVSEQQFALIPVLKPDLDSKEVMLSLRYLRAINIFNVINLGNLQDIPLIASLHKPRCLALLKIIPSAGMMQSFLTAMCGDNAVRMNFVLGASSLKAIRQNGLDSSRDVGIPLAPLVSLPKKVDDLQATERGYIYHDFYHCIVATWTPPQHRELMIDAVDAMKRHKFDKSTAAAYGILRYYLRDMEHIIYLPHEFTLASEYSKILPQGNPQMFWTALVDGIEVNDLTSAQKEVVADFFVERYAMQGVGKNKGVTGEDLLTLADVIRLRIADMRQLKLTSSRIDRRIALNLQRLENSIVFRMSELYRQKRLTNTKSAN